MCENNEQNNASEETQDEKKQNLENEQEQNEQIREMGQVMLDNNEKKSTGWSFLPSLVRWKVMSQRRLTAKQPSMSMYFQSWP